MDLLYDKKAVITGGTRGLGLAIARAYIAEGASVLVASRSQAAVDDAVRELGEKASGFAADVTDLAQVEALADYAVKTFGRIDIWVNNAGTAGPYGPTLDLAPDAFYQVIQTNIVGVYNGSQAAMTRFLAQGSGKLINVLGRGYKGPVPWQNAYSASKAWVRSFTMALAAETKASGVGVYAFAPGMVVTDLLTNVEVTRGSEQRLKVLPTIIRMWAKPPEDASRRAVWIASVGTDCQTGLLISDNSRWQMLPGALREGWCRLLRRPVPAVPVHLKTIPPYQR